MEAQPGNDLRNQKAGPVWLTNGDANLRRHSFMCKIDVQPPSLK
jgi:hypothetical protein